MKILKSIIGGLALLAFGSIIAIFAYPAIAEDSRRLFTEQETLKELHAYLVRKRENKAVQLVFVGDIMFDRGVRSSVERNWEGDYHQLFERVTDGRNADI